MQDGDKRPMQKQGEGGGEQPISWGENRARNPINAASLLNFASECPHIDGLLLFSHLL